MTSYFSTGVMSGSMDVCHETFTEVGVRNVTVKFSGAGEIDPVNGKHMQFNYIAIVGIYFVCVFAVSKW